MQNYEALVERIAQSANMQKEEIERKIEAKKAKLSGLISKEGAAQIVAAELNVSFDNVQLKISELMPGMKKVNLIGKVINLFPVREFSKGGREGKVVNLIIADETSNIRIVLWDTNHIELIEKGAIKENDVVEISNAGMRESEIHLGSFSDIRKSDKILENVKTEKIMQEKEILEILPGQNIKIRGTVVQLFNPRFFHICPECNKKATQESDGFTCQEHGKVQAKERAILNFVIDDGTESIRVVMFSDQINKLLPEEDLKDTEKLTTFREDFLGKEVWLSGSARNNKLFGNIEIISQDVKPVDVEDLIVQLEKPSK